MGVGPSKPEEEADAASKPSIQSTEPTGQPKTRGGQYQPAQGQSNAGNTPPSSKVAYPAIEKEVQRILRRNTAESTHSLSGSEHPLIDFDTPVLENIFRFENFNADVILEVLQYYVATQTDGAFILMLVSRSWCDFVLGSPVLWSWITVDESSIDWVEKLHVCTSITTSPLQIVLRLPIVEWSPLISCIARCKDLYVEIPEYMSGTDVTEDTRVLLESPEFPATCKVHWYREGRELGTELREPLHIPISNVTTLSLLADGSEHPNYHRYAINRDTRHLEQGDEYHPLVLLKTFHLLEVVRNASSLRTLIISHHSMDPLFSDIELPLVTLIALQELQLLGINFSRNGSLFPFASCIKTPNLSLLSLSGGYADMMDVLNHLNLPRNLTKLSLHSTSWHAIMSLRQPSQFDLPSVTALHFRVDQPSFGAFEQGVLIPHIKKLVASLQGLLEVHFTLPPAWHEQEMIVGMLIDAKKGILQRIYVDSDIQGNIVALLEYKKNVNPSILSISGTPLLVSGFALSISPNKARYISSIGFVGTYNDQKPKVAAVEYVRILMDEAELDGTATNMMAMRALLATLRLPSSRLVIPLEWYTQKLTVPMALLLAFQSYTSETESSDQEIPSPPPKITGFDSIMFTRFPRDPDLSMGFANSIDVDSQLIEPIYGVISRRDSLSFSLTEEHFKGMGLERLLWSTYAWMRSMFSLSMVTFTIFWDEQLFGKFADIICVQHPAESLLKNKGIPPCSRESPLQPKRMIKIPDQHCLATVEVSLFRAPGPMDIIRADFSSLTTLKCTPYVLLSILSNNVLPLLQSIELKWPGKIADTDWVEGTERELRYFDAKIVKWFKDHGSPFKRLRTFGMSWYPAWSDFTTILKALVASAEGEDIVIKLPAYPHASIRALILSYLRLEGNVPHTFPTRPPFHKCAEDENYSQLHPSAQQWKLVDSAPPESRLAQVYKYIRAEKVVSPSRDPSPSRSPQCYFCTASGLKCNDNHFGMPYCDLHSIADLVEFTKDTIVEDEEEEVIRRIM